MMDVEKLVNIDGVEQEELCIEKGKFRTLDGVELDSFAPETCTLVRSDEMMEIERTENVDDSKCDDVIERKSDGMMEIDKLVNVVGYLKCVDGTKLEELCLSKENFRTSDGTELNYYAKNCAPKTCIMVRSDKMIEIENLKNIDDPKHDRKWVVDDAAEHEEVCIKKQNVDSLDGVELDCCATNQVKTRAPKSVDGVEVEHCATSHELDTVEGVEVEHCATHREHKSIGDVKVEGCSTNLTRFCDYFFRVSKKNINNVYW
ncbi:hypothetical protein P3S67_021519 [Capsicum chacoense]